MKKRIVQLILAFLVFFCACSENPTGPACQKEIAVYGFLWVEQPLSRERAIAVTWTQAITDYYQVQSAAVVDAHITLTEASSGRIYPLSSDGDRPGFYYNDTLIVQEQTAYTLIIQRGDRIVTAVTTTPGRITLETELSRTEINTVQPENVGHTKPIAVHCASPQQVILIDITCREAYHNAEYIKAFGSNKYPEDQQEYDGGRNSQPRHLQMPIRYADLASEEYDGRPVIFWYGAMLNFYGANTLQILAIDDNYHRYLYQEHPALSGGIQGGIGVFGAVSGESYDLQVVKAP